MTSRTCERPESGSPSREIDPLRAPSSRRELGEEAPGRIGRPGPRVSRRLSQKSAPGEPHAVGNAVTWLMPTVLLLCASNVFMTFAWYGHLKYGHSWPLWKAILVSWGIALVEYCLAVPANRLGYGHFSGFQLKVIQEVVTLTVFTVFAIVFLKERVAWNHLVAFLLLGLAAFFAFAVRAPAADAARVR